MTDQRVHLKASGDLLTVAARNQGEVSINEIHLKPLLAYAWWNNLPVIETVLDVVESTLKKTVYDVMPHDELLIEYTLRTNDIPDDSNEVEIIFNGVSADGVPFEVSGDLLLMGEDSRGFLKRMTAFRRRTDENIIRVI